MISTPENMPQHLLSALGGISLATYLIFMIQILSAVQTPNPDNSPILILNLLELSQTKIPVKTENRPVKKQLKKIKKVKPEKPLVKKITKPELALENTVPDLNNISTKPIVNQTRDSSDSDSIPTPVPFYKLSDLPRFKHRETPVYPEDMRASGKKGTVTLMVLIDKTGRVRKITILKSAGDSFDQAAINAIRASTFMPAKVDGKPVTALLKMPVKFKLL